MKNVDFLDCIQSINTLARIDKRVTKVYLLYMKVVSLKDLKKNLHSFTELVHKGTRLFVTRYNKPYVVIVPSNDTENLHLGSKSSNPKLSPAIKVNEKTDWLSELEKDREE